MSDSYNRAAEGIFLAVEAYKSDIGPNNYSPADARMAGEKQYRIKLNVGAE